MCLPSRDYFLLLILISLLVVVFFLTRCGHELRNLRVGKLSLLLAAGIVFFSAIYIYGLLVHSSLAGQCAELLGLSAPRFAAVGSVGFAVASLPFMSCLLAYMEKGSLGAPSGMLPAAPLGDEERLLRYRGVLRLLIVISFLVLFATSFSNSMWLDPIYSMLIVELPWPQFMEALRSDVHPPLYYFILKGVEEVASLVSTELAFKFMAGKFVSLSAYVLTGILLWKKFKGSANPVLREMLLLCLVLTASMFNHGTEVRMYSWALFFMTGTYLYARDIMQGRESLKVWILFVFYSMGCAYTHNFTLVAMAFAWFYLLLWILRYERRLFKAWFAWASLVALAYLPWLLILLAQTGRIAGKYWIPEFGVATSLRFVYDMMPGVLLCVPIAVILNIKQCRIREKEARGEALGVFLPVAVLLSALAVSYLYFPIVQSRYLIPCAFCLWLNVMFWWSRMKGRPAAIIVVLIALVTCSSCFSYIKSNYTAHCQLSHVMRSLDAIEREALICLDSTSTHHSIPLGYLARRPVYVENEGELSTFRSLLRTNLAYVDEPIAQFARRRMQEGKTVYYLAFNPLPDELREDEACASGIEMLQLYGGMARLYKFAPR